MKKEYLVLSVYVEKWIKEKYGAMIITINDDDNFIIIEKNNKFYKMRMTLRKDKEIKITNEDIRMKKMIEEAIKNYDISSLRKFKEYLDDETDLNDMIKETINKIVEFDELKGVDLNLEDIRETNYTDLYKYYLHKKDLIIL